MPDKRIDRFAQVNFGYQSQKFATEHIFAGAIGHISNDSIVPIRKFDFDRCPICMSRDNLTVEHVPPAQAGGTALTTTCRPCNSAFGSLVDVDLIDLLSASTESWWNNPNSSVRGARRSPRTLLRGVESGEFVVVISGDEPFRRSLKEMTATGNIDGVFRSTDLRRARASGLKNAYLAACVQLRRIPQNGSAKLVRDELMRIRQLKLRRISLPPSPISDNIPLARCAEIPPIAPGVYTCQLFTAAQEQQNAILVGRHLIVGWPFPELSPSR